MDKTKSATMTFKAYCPHCCRFCKHRSTVKGEWETLKCLRCGWKRAVRTG